MTNTANESYTDLPPDAERTISNLNDKLQSIMSLPNVDHYELTRQFLIKCNRRELAGIADLNYVETSLTASRIRIAVSIQRYLGVTP